MRKINSLKDINHDVYKHIIALTPEDARVVKTAFEFLPKNVANEPEMKSLLKAVDSVASADDIIDVFNDPSNCEVCDD
jgi:hypothetical protein